MSPHTARSLEIVAALAARSGPAQGQPSAPTTPAPTTQTRATFWGRKNGGGYRTARTPKKCEQFGCFARIMPGEQYFDTQEVTTWPQTKCICARCAEEEV